MAHEPNNPRVDSSQYLARGINLITPQDVALHSRATLDLLGKEIDHQTAQGGQSSDLLFRVAQLFSVLLQAYESTQCDHVIVDIRNPKISSGYMCTKCGTLFKAGDHI